MKYLVCAGTIVLLAFSASSVVYGEDLDPDYNPGKIDLSKPVDDDKGDISDLTTKPKPEPAPDAQYSTRVDDPSGGPSIYGGEDFSDTDFSKETFRDFVVRKFQQDLGTTSNWGVSESRSKDTDNKARKTTAQKRDDKKKKEFDHAKNRLKEMREEFWRDLTTPHYELPGDWVPDKIDPLQNGGFGTAPDNGAPVPFRLNGHVDIERGLPWDIKD